MRVLRLIPFFSNRFGGAMNHVKNLCIELNKLGHMNIIYTSDLNYHDDGQGFEVRPFPVLFRLRHYLYTPHMKNQLLKEDFDVIHAHLYRNYQSDLAKWLSKRSGRPYIFTAHGSIPSVFLNDRIVKLAYDIVIGKKTVLEANGVVAVSHAEVTHYLRIGVDPRKIHVIPHGVDAKMFRPEIKPDKFVDTFNLNGFRIILYAGRLHRRKGLTHLLVVFSSICKECNDVKLVLAGPDDGYKGHLIKLCRTLRLEDRVVFTDFLSQEMLIHAYNAAQLFVNPAKYEIFGHVLLEASACAVPCVATNWGASSDIIIHGKTGLLVNGYGNLRDLKKSILYLLRKPDKATEMGLAAREYVSKNFSWKNCAIKHIELYNKALGY